MAWRYRAGQNQGRDVSARPWLMQYACSARAHSTHGRCLIKCRGMLEVSGEVGKQHNYVSDRGKIKGQGGLVRRPSSQSKPEVMPNLAVHSGCLIKCQRHLGSSWSGQILQISVSVDVREGGEVGLQKGEIC